jgi:hypothetical protein
MRRLAAFLLLASAALMLTSSAPGLPSVPGDPTPPVVTPVISGTLGTNGWYVTNTTVAWSITDPESIILSTSGCDTRTFAADTGGVSLTCSATSDGGTATIEKAFKVDKTAPDASATPSRHADANGWYNHALTVDFAGTDATSGLQSCSPSQTYGGPDSGSATVSGTCRDLAGNAAPAALALRYDQTPPSASPTARAPDSNGWHNHSVTVTFQGSDATSGVHSCTQVTYAGPDDPSVSLGGTCVDQAGNRSSTSVLTLRYDQTSPAATATASRGPDVNGWYNQPVTLSFGASDVTSGVDACDGPKTYSGPNTTSTSVTGSCRDHAGNVASTSASLRYDASGPQVTTTPARAANANGWYNAPLAVGFAGADPVSGVASCDANKTYSGPDSAAATVVGTCRDNAGNTGAGLFPLKYDVTAPQTSATPSRQPGPGGWYNAPLSVTFVGTDATSGIGGCDAARSYSGPDTAAVSLSGTCRDRAGNQSAAGAFDFKYDATAPQVTTAAGRAPNANGWYTAPVAVSFTGSDAMSGGVSCDPTKTYSGPDSAVAAVVGTCRDDAGNTGAGSHALRYDATAPQVATSPARAANANGWYNAPLAVTFSGADPASGVASCDANKTYSGPDSATATVVGTCRDTAGNTGTGSFPLKYDATIPQTSASASRQPNANGWYNAPLSVSFAGTDVTSGIASCDSPKSYSGPDSATAAVVGTCRDRAGNQQSASQALRYDATAPQASATPSRQPNTNGWYNAPFSVSFAGSDAMSGLESCDADKTYSGPDSATAAVFGSCRDRAGNQGFASQALRYDATAPQASATASRQPNANGWYNASLSVSFNATDALSGFDSCPAPQTYAGPDSAAAVVSGTCRDKAGNGMLAALALKYDETAPQTSALPSPQPNSNGWNKTPVTVAFVATDATAGVETCDAPKAYAGPDTSSVTLAGACRDRAGNSNGGSMEVKYDATAPLVTGVPVRPPDRDGWYNRPVAFALLGTDATSGIDGSCSTVSYAGPDSATASISGSCSDRAGNPGAGSLTFRYDATGPNAVASPSRRADVNGWYNQPLTVSYAGSDPVSGLDSCSPPENYSGPDSASAIVGGICLDRAGNASLAAIDLRYDGTAPQVTGSTPSRVPDSNGWYSSPLTVRFQGSDATSQIEACTEAQYAGPDAGAASVSGSCRDRAGNGSAPGAFTLKYDSTRPSFTSVTVKTGNGTAALSWMASGDTVLVEVRRASRVVYQGTGRSFTDKGLVNGVRYRYSLTGYDEAHNAATVEAFASPIAPLMSPRAGAVVSSPPRLAWRAVPNTKYYNVQVLRRGRIFSAWPRSTSLQLKRTWTYRGQRYRLTPGRYRWYVWPGRGRPSEKRFGRLIGSSSFVVR